MPQLEDGEDKGRVLQESGGGERSGRSAHWARSIAVEPRAGARHVSEMGAILGLKSLD